MKLLHLSFALSLFLLLSSCLPQAPTSRLQLASQGAYSGAIDDLGNSAVIGSYLHGGSFWDLKKQARTFNWNHRQGYLTEILYSDISADGHYALTANYFNLVLWDTRTGQSVWFWSAPAKIEAVALSAEGRFALLGLTDNSALLFDIQNGGILREFTHMGPVVSVAVNIAAGIAVTGSEDTTARLWSIPTGDLIHEFKFSNQVPLIVLSPSGQKALLVPANEKAELWNLKSREKIATLRTAKFRLYSGRFIGETRLLVGTTHRNIFEFDAENGKKVKTWKLGTEGKQAFKSAIVLDLGWHQGQLWAIGSNGYLYAF
jgi:WD40 repeat protein